VGDGGEEAGFADGGFFGFAAALVYFAFEGFAVGDVGEGADAAEDFAVFIADGGGAGEESESAAGGEEEFEFVGGGFFAAEDGAPEGVVFAGEFLACAVELPGATAGGEGFEGAIDGDAEEECGGGVEADVGVVGVGDDDADGEGAEDGFEAAAFAVDVFEEGGGFEGDGGLGGEGFEEGDVFFGPHAGLAAVDFEGADGPAVDAEGGGEDGAHGVADFRLGDVEVGAEGEVFEVGGLGAVEDDVGEGFVDGEFGAVDAIGAEAVVAGDGDVVVGAFHDAAGGSAGAHEVAEGFADVVEDLGAGEVGGEGAGEGQKMFEGFFAGGEVFVGDAEFFALAFEFFGLTLEFFVLASDFFFFGGEGFDGGEEVGVLGLDVAAQADGDVNDGGDEEEVNELQGEVGAWAEEVGVGKRDEMIDADDGDDGEAEGGGPEEASVAEPDEEDDGDAVTDGEGDIAEELEAQGGHDEDEDEGDQGDGPGGRGGEAEEACGSMIRGEVHVHSFW
jgi:hypothetical protein